MSSSLGDGPTTLAKEIGSIAGHDLFNAVCRYNGQNGGIFRRVGRGWPDGNSGHLKPLRLNMYRVLSAKLLVYSGHIWGKDRGSL